MIVKSYKYSLNDNTVVERLIDTKNVSIAHAVIEPGDRLPKHDTNAIARIIIVRGELTIKINEKDVATYGAGNVIEIPKGTTMELLNQGSNSIEFFAIKAPSPTYRED